MGDHQAKSPVLVHQSAHIGTATGNSHLVAPNPILLNNVQSSKANPIHGVVAVVDHPHPSVNIQSAQPGVNEHVVDPAHHQAHALHSAPPHSQTGSAGQHSPHSPQYSKDKLVSFTSSSGSGPANRQCSFSVSTPNTYQVTSDNFGYPT